VANGVCEINGQLGAGGIPHVALLNPKGVIVFKGHPASIDLEKAIDDLLEKGESSLCPLEDSSGAQNENEDGGEGAGKTLSAEKCNELLDKFDDTFRKLKGSDEIMKGCKAAQRAFFVMEHGAKFNASKETMEHDLTLHLVMVGGTNDTLSKIKETTKELREATEYLTVKEQCMGQN